MKAITQISKSFDVLVPTIADSYYNTVKSLFDHLHTTYNGNLRGLYNTWGMDGANFRALVAKNINHSGSRNDSICTLNTDRLAKNAKDYAEDQVARFVIKLEKKLEDLDTVETPNLYGDLGFNIKGTLGDRHVTVEQRCILKQSSTGKLFNQWPALIWVDGKKLSEKQFKELSA